jgi:branched-chain amino acid transport system ATP-binding protein
MAFLELRDVIGFYGDILVLWEVSLGVDAGEVVSLLGSNGAGKSTLLKTVMGMVRARSGVVELGGERIEGLSPDQIVEKGIAYVPEGRHPLPDFTVEENLKMGSFPKRARPHLKEEMKKAFDLFPRLREKAKQKAGTLSGGEAQMLAIGRALMSRPKLLMLDEPSAGLSPTLVGKIFETISSISKDSLAVLIVEQDVGRALSVSARGYVLENGAITRSGTGNELLQDESVKQAYLGI